MKEAADTCMVWMGNERFLLEELVCMHYGAFHGMYIRFLGLQFMENLFIYLFFDLALLLLYSLRTGDCYSYRLGYCRLR
jgi:hypothetical protein